MDRDHPKDNKARDSRNETAAIGTSTSHSPPPSSKNDLTHPPESAGTATTRLSKKEMEEVLTRARAEMKHFTGTASSPAPSRAPKPVVSEEDLPTRELSREEIQTLLAQARGEADAYASASVGSTASEPEAVSQGRSASEPGTGEPAGAADGLAADAQAVGAQAEDVVPPERGTPLRSESAEKRDKGWTERITRSAQKWFGQSRGDDE